MKKIHQQLFPVIIIALSALTFTACGGEVTEEKPAATKDSTILDNYNNNYPNNQIHLQDSSVAADSARMKKDSVK